MLINYEAPHQPMHDPAASWMITIIVPADESALLEFVVDVNTFPEDLRNVEAQVIRMLRIFGKHELGQVLNFFDNPVDKATLDEPHMFDV